jgi:hypothetical protein
MFPKKTHLVATALAALLGFVAASLPAIAHHGFRGEYNTAQPIYIEGVVDTVEIAPPHVELALTAPSGVAVPSTLDKIADINIENALAKTVPAQAGSYDLQLAGTEFVGMLEGRIKPGDRIAVMALRNCQPPHEHRSRWIRLADGEIVTVTGRTQAEVEGCD